MGDETVQGIRRPVDVLVLQEQASVSTTTQAIVDALNAIHGPNVYRRGRINGGTNGGGRAGIVFNSRTVDLLQERALGRLSTSGQARQTLRYQLRPIGYDDAAGVYVYVNHYKSGTTDRDITRRNVEAMAVRADADRLGPNANVIYAGDFNITNCDEAMFQTLTAPGTAQALDPMADFATGCQWKDNSAFRRLHTQSPAATGATGLVQGGVDDRFDFQLVTENLLDGQGLSLIPGSYRAFGNNGTHRMNRPISDSNNTALPRSVLNALATASDHLPVVADYQLPAVMHLATTELPDRALFDATLPWQVNIANGAPVDSPLGADTLAYQLTLRRAGEVLESQAGVSLATEPSIPHNWNLPTDVLGSHRYTLEARSESQAVANHSINRELNYHVLSPAIPSWFESRGEQRSSVSVVLPRDVGTRTLPIPVHNVATAGIESELLAGLDLLSLEWSEDVTESPVTTDFEPVSAIPPGASHSLSLDVDTTQTGRWQNELRLQVSDDQMIWGARTSELVLDTDIRVAWPGDANLDSHVDFEDFLVLSSNFGLSDVRWSDGDFNVDGTTDFGDFLVLSANFGRSTIAVVPEPIPSAPWLVLLAAFLARKVIRKTRTQVAPILSVEATRRLPGLSQHSVTGS